ncbi:MAG: LamG domain-containing protein [candidate division KSB1 bacterium]|nr:LamG domain-containing protein [candidate division KSB1 bacterium]
MAAGPPDAYSRIEVPLTPNDLGPAATVCLWYKPNWDYRNRESFRHAIIENHTGFTLFEAAAAETKRIFQLSWGDGGEYLSFRMEDEVDRDYEVPEDKVSETTVLPKFHQLKSNQWYHIAVTWDFSEQPHTIALFVNGEEIGRTTMNGQDFAKFEPFTFGAHRHDYQGNGSANGVLDDIRAYNRVLNIKEIDQLYQNNKNIKDGLLMYLSFD